MILTSLKKTIYVDFIRHGEPEGGDILRGRVNPELTELGWAQMKMSANLTSECERTASTPGWTEILTSPLKRCNEFADRLAKKLDVPVTIDQDWQEIDYGDWDGMPIKQWKKEAAGQFEAFSKDLSALRPPNGEDYLSFKGRILEAFEKFSEFPDESHILVVTHGGVLRVLIPHILGMPLNKSGPLHIPFACYSRVKISLANSKTNKFLIFHNKGESLDKGKIV